MALDPEELKKRRQQRKEYQAKKKRKLWLRLAIAALVLIAVGVLLIVLIPGDEAAPADREESADISEGPTEATEPPTTTVHLAFTGDLNVTDALVASGGSEQDYTGVFLDVAHILAEADLTAVNLEGNLCGTPYGGDSASAPQALAESLKRAGVDLVQLANSYAIHNGISGLGNTIDSVRAAGMEPVGVAKDKNDYRIHKGYTIRTVQGIKIAFVAFTKGMDGMALPPGSENCVNLLYTDYESSYRTINTQGITDLLQDVSRERPDVTIALVHWGSEYNDNISESQKTIVSLMKKNGVNAIIGTHSHYLQKMDFDAENGTFVAYSLGDFVSDADKSGSQYSVILDLAVTKDNRSGKTVVSDFSYTPIYIFRENRTTVRVLRLEEAITAYEDSFIGGVTEEVYEDMKYVLKRIEVRIHGEEE